MKLTEFSIDHAVSVYVLIIAILFGGFFAYQDMPREAAPDVAIPMVIVSTPYFGVSPADMETLVTQPMEREFQGLRDLEEMTSTSAEGVSLITLEFDPDVAIEDALQRVRSDVDRVEPDLPSDAEDPEIIEINASDWPVLVANISGDMDPLRLQQLAEEMEDDIESQSAVLEANIAGGIEREIEVQLHPEKLRHHNVSANQVIDAIQTENVNLPGGSIDIGSMNYIVRVAGEFVDIDPLRHIIVAEVDGEPVHLRDVADVEDTFEERDTYSRLTTWQEADDGTRTPRTRPNISMAVVKRAGDNIIDVAEDTKEIIAEYERRAGDQVEITIVNDMSTQIESIVHDLENNLLTGMILVFLVLFLFMGGVRNALFVAVAVPLSMLLSILILSFMGVTLNMVVLFALLLSLGMLVDNAVVVVENIYRFATTGKNLRESAIEGTTEVGWAIIAATFTTVAAFFPMLFWPGTMGEFMGYLPLTVVITLLSSLFVALVINPTLCATLMDVDDDIELEDESVPDLRIYRIYRAMLVWCLNRRIVVTGITVIALVGTLMAYGNLNHGVEFFPESTPEQFTVQLTMPDGTNLDYTDQVLMNMQEPIGDETDLVTAWITDTGTQGGGQIGGGGQAAHYGQITVELKPLEEQTSSPRAFMDRLREVYSRIPGTEVILDQQDMGPPTGDPISIEVAGDDLETLSAVSQSIRQQIRTIPGVTDLSDDLELTRPEIHVDIDRQRASMAGLSTNAVATTVRTAIAGTDTSVFREDEDEYDIVVRLQEESRESPADIRQLTVVNNQGVHIPLEEVADVDVKGGSGSIRRKAQERVVTISGNVEEGYLAPVLLEQIQGELTDLDLPAGYDLSYGGEQEDMEDATDFLTRALLAAIFLIAIILVTEFNSIVQPFLILISVTLSLIGVLWSLVLTGMPFGVIMTGIGIISLSGVVVNNSIVLIDYINQLRERGYSRREALVTGGLVRFRPVALTAVTTMLGLTPIVLGISLDFVNAEISMGGTSVEMWGPMANAVVFGLLAATILTLIVVPVMYSLLDDISQFGQKIIRRISTAGLIITLAVMVVPAIAQAQVEGESPPQPGVEDVEDVDGDLDELLDHPDELPRHDLDDIAELDAESDVDIDVERTLTLAEARQLVYEDHYDVQLAQTQIDIADGTIRQAYGAVLPTFSASGDYTINQEERTADFGVDEDQLPPGMDDMGGDEIVVQPRTDYRWSLSANLSLNFRAWPMINQAYAQRELAHTEVEMTREALDEAVIQSYYNLLVVRRTVDLSAQQVDSAQTMYNSLQTQYDAGTATEFQVTRAELELHQNRRELENARLQFIEARKAFAELLQTDADFDIDRPARPDAPGAELDREQQLIERAEEQRAVFEADRLNEEISTWAVREVFAQYLPSLSATFSYGGSRDTEFQPGEPQWMLTFGAEWVLWDGGGREGELDQARARAVASDIQSRQTRHELSSEIEQAIADVEAARTQRDSARTEVELAERNLSQAEASFRHGVSSQLDVINARDQLQIARLAELQEELQVDLSIYRLLTIIDGTDAGSEF